MKKTGYWLTGLGVLATLASLSLDLFGIGQRGIQAAQLLGVNVGIVVAFFGIGLSKTTFNNEKLILEKLKQVLNAPVVIWVLAGFLIVYITFFIFPVFFNTTSRMFYFFRYIPDQYPIGGDLSYNTGAIKEWLLGNNPYSVAGHFYPPLYHIVFAPVLLLGYPTNYYFITTITLLSFLFITFILPALLTKGKSTAILLFFLLTGLFSYGLQFELERGQFNVIAMVLCLTAIYLFHVHAGFRYLAYLLFSVSIHLKLYPAIFIVMFIKDWKDWKNNLFRLAGLGAFNIALLFVAGPDVFNNFIQALNKNTGIAGWTFPGNHSIKAFAYNLTHTGYGSLSPETLPWLKGNAPAIELILTACFGICFLVVLFKTYRENSGGLNVDLLLACMLGGMLLPAVSIDYKLELLAAPLAIALYNRVVPEKTWQKVIFVLAIMLTSLAYSLTLVPYKFRLADGILVNGLPMLFTILMSMTIVCLISKTKTAHVTAPSDPAIELA